MLKPYSTHWSVGKRKKPLQISSLISWVLNQKFKITQMLSLVAAHFMTNREEQKSHARPLSAQQNHPNESTFHQKNRILSFFVRFTEDNLNFLC